LNCITEQFGYKAKQLRKLSFARRKLTRNLARPSLVYNWCYELTPKVTKNKFKFRCLRGRK